VARETREGRIHRCGERTTGGFPFRMEIECRDLVSTSGSGDGALTVRARSVRAVAQIYRPNHVIADVIGPVEIVSPGLTAPLLVTFQTALASRRGDPDAMTRLDVAVEGLHVRTIDGASGDWKARSAQMHLRRATRPQDFDVAISAEGFEIPRAPAPVRLSMTGLAVSPPDKWNDLGTLFRLWRAQPDARFDVVGSRIEAGRLLISAKGAATLGETGLLNGEFVTDVAGADALAAWLAGDSSGVMNVLTRAGLSLLGDRVKLEERQAVRLQTVIRNGEVKMGPLTVARIPPLFR
jgi:hypothetical protein